MYFGSRVVKRLFHHHNELCDMEPFYVLFDCRFWVNCSFEPFFFFFVISFIAAKLIITRMRFCV